MWPVDFLNGPAAAEIYPLSLHDALPIVDACHCTMGAGDPLAAAVNVAVCPSVTLWSPGWVVTTGPTAGGELRLTIAMGLTVGLSFTWPVPMLITPSVRATLNRLTLALLA